MVSGWRKPPFAVTWAIPMDHVSVTDPFWSPRQVLMAMTSLPRQYTKLEEYHHVDNFRVAAGEKDSVFVGMFYYDSDLYKWIEAATYALSRFKNEQLATEVERIVSLVVKSQKPDGYINTYFTINFPEERMKHFQVMHEMYCGGHLIEAAVARHELFGKDDLLGCAKRFADFLIAFDPPGTNMSFVPGHQEVELALVRLYRCTGMEKYLDLAARFIDKRGMNPKLTRTAFRNAMGIASLLKRQDANLNTWERVHGEITKPATTRTWEAAPISLLTKLRFAASYMSGRFVQQYAPVRDQHEPVGHAVRAMYMYAAMADLLVERKDLALVTALRELWCRMTQSRMYINGGIGSLPMIEGFGRDHELDNEKAYCETCAAIGSFLWNWRMLQATGDVEHADLMELVLYNAILPCWSIDGTRYRYNNPLASRNGSERREWFSCACCPPNIGRIVSGLGQYIATTDGEASVTISQYIGSSVDVPLADGSYLSFELECGFPWDTKAKITFKEAPGHPIALQLRVPAWSSETSVAINDDEPTLLDDWGFFHSIERTWMPGDAVHVELKAETAFILPDPKVRANQGRVAIKHGPILYCIEHAGNPVYKFDQLGIDITSVLESRMEPGLLGGIAVVEGKMIDSASKEIKKFTAIPYFAWGNREKGPMEVWLKCIH